MKDNCRHRLAATLLFASLAYGLLLEYVIPHAGTDAAALLHEAGARLGYAGAAGALCALFDQPLAQPAKKHRTVLSCAALLLCFAVAVNNLPWIALLTGQATLHADLPAVCAFAAVCLATALFEETLFRALLLRLLLARMGRTRRACFAAVLLSSAIFAISHLANLAVGADPGATLLQVGYSFLVGCAAAVLYLLFERIALPIAFHAVYNFGGLLVPRLGEGRLFDLPTVLLTAALATACVCVLWVALCRLAKKYQEK